MRYGKRLNAKHYKLVAQQRKDEEELVDNLTAESESYAYELEAQQK